MAIHGENPLPRPQLPKDRGAARLDQDFQAGHVPEFFADVALGYT
jgi:hypothetical protein